MLGREADRSIAVCFFCFDREKYPPEKLMGRPLCMYTYSRMFNSCVIPGEDCDEMREYPHTSKHILVFRNNCIWALQVFDDNGEEVPLADILRCVMFFAISYCCCIDCNGKT